MDGFSAGTKSELAQLKPEQACCRRAELAGLVHAAGRIRLSSIDGLALVIETEHPAVARKIMWLFRECFGLTVEVILEERARLGKHHGYRIEAPAGTDSRRVLHTLEILDHNNQLDGGVSSTLTRSECCRWSFLRGAFLGAGSIADPAKTTYHLEFVPESPELAEGLYYLLSLGHLRAKMATRKNMPLVYLKESDSIVRLLSEMGAHHAVLSIQELRVMREMRGGVNRMVNAETANVAKAAESGAEQAKMVADIERWVGLDRLPPRIREFAVVRMENPEMSLRELGAIFSPPLGKSAVNHRLRWLREFWKEHVPESQGVDFRP